MINVPVTRNNRTALLDRISMATEENNNNKRMALLEDLLKYLDRGNSLEHCKGASGRKIDGRVRVGFSGDE